ncbi:MAG: PPC domain-containing DNA-binding protein [Phycisphaerae bacterium]
MKTITHSGPMEMVVVALEPDELLLESIEQAVAENGIRNGMVVSGIGTLKTCHMHYIKHTGFPSDNGFYKLQKPLELLSVSGIIADGEPHLHIVCSCGENEVYCGHLEHDSKVCYLAEIAILKCNGMEMTRTKDDRGVSLLGPKD